MLTAPPPPLAGQRVVLATYNISKINELEHLLAPLGWQISSAKGLGLTMPQEGTAPEGATLRSNAALKAETLCKHTTSWALADDSGLFISALPDALGVDTALYGGPAKLLEAMKNIPEGQRGAHFRCVVALARPGQATLLAEGAIYGHIGQTLQGSGGFGYDPIFIAAGETLTTAERIDKTGLRTKDADHRGQAIKALIAQLSAEAAI